MFILGLLFGMRFECSIFHNKNIHFNKYFNTENPEYFYSYLKHDPVRLKVNGSGMGVS